MIHESTLQIDGVWMLCEYETMKSGAIRMLSLGSVEARDLPDCGDALRPAKRPMEELARRFLQRIPDGRKIVIVDPQDGSSRPRRQLLKRDLLPSDRSATPSTPHHV